jgi:hypothetical protein
MKLFKVIFEDELFSIFEAENFGVAEETASPYGAIRSIEVIS